MISVGVLAGVTISTELVFRGSIGIPNLKNNNDNKNNNNDYNNNNNNNNNDNNNKKKT